MRTIPVLPLRCAISALIGLSGVAFAAPSLVDGGISLNQTRVIFLSDDKAQVLEVKNSGQERFLIQSRIEMASTETSSAPFVVTPPLFTLPPDSRQQLRIVSQKAALPVDRESLFFLSLLAIPAHQAMDTDVSKVSMGMRFRLKLFYRPTALSSGPGICSLRISAQPGGAFIKNPTPFYQTVAYLKVNNKPVNLNTSTSMLAPYSSQYYSVDERVKQAEWQTINDYGLLAEACHQQVSSTEDVI